MSVSALPNRSLVAKLALFYAALSLIALVLVKSALLLFEFRALEAELEQGGLKRAVDEAAAQLEGELARAQPGGRAAELERALAYLLWRIERPEERSESEAANVLNEVSDQPLGTRLIGPAGEDLAGAPAGAAWRPAAFGPSDRDWSRLLASERALELARAEPPELMRRYGAALRDRDGRLEGVLLVELRLPLPWRKVLMSGTLEWPMLLAYLLAFGLGSALFLRRYVTRRFNRIEAAAHAWSRGDFAPVIADPSADEIGRLSRELNRMAAELRTLVGTRARLATLEERQRLARDLHDTVKQKAFALQLQLATALKSLGAADPAVVARVEEGRRITEEIQRELAQILDELRAPPQAHSLPRELEQRAEDFARRSSIAAHARIALSGPVPDEQHEAVLRIVDEALANVLRHSGAKRVEIGLGDGEGELRLSIADDGRGGAREVETGMGIANMRARAVQLPGGRFELGPAPGGGTSVSVCWRAV